MFPPMNRDKPRGAELLGWSSFACLNIGLIMRAAGEPMLFLDPAGAGKWLVILSAFLQWAGGMFYVGHIWERVKGKQVSQTNSIRIL